MKTRKVDIRNESDAFILTRQDSTSAYSCIRNGVYFENRTMSCQTHIRGLRDVTKYKGVYKFGTRKADAFWEFITDKDSIYHPFMKYVDNTILTYDGKPIGFQLSDRVFDFASLPLVYAFLIDTRVPQEAPTFLSVWDKLVGLGVSKRLAYVMARYFYNENQVSTNGLGHLNWTGCHQILNDASYRMDFKMFLDGKYRKDIDEKSNTSQLWRMKNPPVMDLFRRVKWDKYGVPAGMYYRKYTDEELVPLSEEIMRAL
jgi:hypothetical protein